MHPKRPMRSAFEIEKFKVFSEKAVENKIASMNAGARTLKRRTSSEKRNSYTGQPR
jgi:hypothetical protein